MNLQKKDFVEIEFTGRVKDGDIFDSNIKEDLDKMSHEGHNHEPGKHPNVKPFVMSLGEGMFLKGVDDFLIGKPSETKEYEIEVSPENAFGERNSKFVQLIPMKIFREQKINPVSGAIFNFDGRIAKILSVSGGRVMVDFNHPMAGKTVVYKLKLLRKIEDINEKTRSLIEFLFRRELSFKVEDKKLIIEVEKNMAKFVEMFKDKFKEILDLNLEVKELEEIKDKKEEDKKVDSKK